MNKKGMVVRKGIFYFPSFVVARAYAEREGWNTDRIIKYDAGWAVQKRVSGPYYGPEDVGGHPLSGVSEMSKAEFHRHYSRVLRAIAVNHLGLKSGEFTVRSNKGGDGVMGEVILHTDKLYVMVGGLRAEETMFRSVKGRKDYTGGMNHWMQTSKLDEDAEAAAEAFRRVMNAGSGMAGFDSGSALDLAKKRPLLTGVALGFVAGKLSK